MALLKQPQKENKEYDQQTCRSFGPRHADVHSGP